MLACELYLIEKDIKDVLNTLTEKYSRAQTEQNNKESKRWIKTEYCEFNMHNCLPLESNNPVLKIMLWKPKGHNGTVVFANSDVNRMMYFINLEKKYSITGIMLDLDLPGESHYLPCYYFQHWGSDNSFRIVRVMCDPRWAFYEEGKRFPFEQTNRYTERTKKKRLTNDMIKDYVTAMGWNIRDDGFFDSDSNAILMTIKRW